MTDFNQDFNSNNDSTNNINNGADINKNNSSNNSYNSEKKCKKSNKGIVALSLVCALIGGIVGSIATNFVTGSGSGDGSGQNITINANSDANIAEAVAAKAMPSVVGITTSGVSQSFFGAVESKGTGSGIIVDSRGYILTNAHVVKLNGQVVPTCKVQLNDGTTVDGKPIWTDTSIDLAIVKINTDKKLKPAELGDSATLKVGEPAIAIGNPIDMAYQRTVTEGIISGLNRYVGQVNGGGYMTGLIQTDASINGGNSGGPLLNEKGQVIGINTVKVQSAEGLGFAIPIDTAKPIIKSVIEKGDYKVVSLGTETIDALKVEQYLNKDLGVKSGVFVYKVMPNSPAAKAGIEDRDVITKINNTDISSVEALKANLYKYKVGDTVDVTIVRDGKPKTVKVTFTDYSVADDKNAQKDKAFNQPGNQSQMQMPNQMPNGQFPGGQMPGQDDDIFSQFGF